MRFNNKTLRPGSRAFGKENWKFHTPDGTLLFVNNEHKMNWYLKKNLIEVIDFDDKTVRFIKQPQEVFIDPFIQTIIEKKCVVCGTEEELQKHHIIPYMYIRHLPEQYKSHNHHDVVILCENHHYHYEKNFSKEMGDKLAQLNNVKTIRELTLEFAYKIKTHSKIRNIAKSLLSHTSVMNIERQELLTQLIIDHTPSLNNSTSKILTKDEVIVALNYHIPIIQDLNSSDYVVNNHAKRIVDVYLNNDNVFELLFLWRKNFIENMKPKYMPATWDINRFHDRGKKIFWKT